MSEPTSPKPGRPASGITKVKPGLTIDRKIVARAKKAAFRQNMSLSAFVERSIACFLEAQKAEVAP